MLFTAGWKKSKKERQKCLLECADDARHEHRSASHWPQISGLMWVNQKLIRNTKLVFIRCTNLTRQSQHVFALVTFYSAAFLLKFIAHASTLSDKLIYVHLHSMLWLTRDGGSFSAFLRALMKFRKLARYRMILSAHFTVVFLWRLDDLMHHKWLHMSWVSNADFAALIAQCHLWGLRENLIAFLRWLI